MEQLTVLHKYPKARHLQCAKWLSDNKTVRWCHAVSLWTMLFSSALRSDDDASNFSFLFIRVQQKRQVLFCPLLRSFDKYISKSLLSVVLNIWSSVCVTFGRNCGKIIITHNKYETLQRLPLLAQYTVYDMVGFIVMRWGKNEYLIKDR